MLGTLSKLLMTPGTGTLIAATSGSVELNAREPRADTRSAKGREAE